jgi:predicted methyltransferase
MLAKYCQSPKSLLDYLLHIMPDLGKNGPAVIFLDMRRPTVNDKAAKALMRVWKDEDNKIGDYKLKRPSTIAKDEIDLMEREGLVKAKGDSLEITPKGAEVIKTMILGDERSALENDGREIDFTTACENLKPKPKTAKKKGSKYAGNDVHSGQPGGSWWSRIKRTTAPGD